MPHLRPTHPLAARPLLLRRWLLWLVLLLGSAAGQAAAGERWQLHIQDPDTGARVYLSSRPGELPAFRAEMLMAVRVSALVAVLVDIERAPQWVYRNRRVNRIEWYGPTHGISQVITAMPWPLLDRDAVVAWRIEQDGTSGAVAIEGHSAPDKLPESADFVRMPHFESVWRFIPQSDGQVLVRFEGQGDPGGNLKLPVVRDFVGAAVWQAPLATINALRKMVERPEYRDAELAFIREPRR